MAVRRVGLAVVFALMLGAPVALALAGSDLGVARRRAGRGPRRRR